MSFQYIIHLANYSDGVLYLLAILFLVELSVIFDRAWFMRSALRKGRYIIHKLSSIDKLDEGTLKELLDESTGLPEEQIINAAYRHLDLVHHYGSARGEAFDNRLDEAIFMTTPFLDKRLWILDTTVTLAPLLGLFGTILGMFHAFSILAAPGHAPTQVTGGVADALIATASGLFIAMIGLITFNAFNNAIDKTIQQLEAIKLLLINRLDSAPNKS